MTEEPAGKAAKGVGGAMGAGGWGRGSPIDCV